MDIIAKDARLSGEITVPSSKSHTNRALIFSMLAGGQSHIRNPLHSADCMAAVRAIQAFGAMADTTRSDDWIIIGAGSGIHLPSNVIDVGNSGSLLSFLAPVAATLPGYTVFTGDSSIRNRPVNHMLDALRQIGCEAFTTQPTKNAAPIVVKGPMAGERNITTEGLISQYISGIMIATSLLEGNTTLKLTNPKETPFVNMTRVWLNELGVKIDISNSFKDIKIYGMGSGGKIASYPTFDKTIPSDWEAVAFPLVAALITHSSIRIKNIDNSKTQGDAAIVDALKLMGADISEEQSGDSVDLIVKPSYLSLEHFADKHLTVNLSGYPDAICALCVAACFTEGTTVIEDIGVCRSKETDRIEVMKNELTTLGAVIKTGEDWMSITGRSSFLRDGSVNPLFNLNGANVDSHKDHRVAMALCCAGLGIRNGKVKIRDAQCSNVSFPNFAKTMNTLGAGFIEV